MRRSYVAALGLAANACISPAPVRVQPAGPDSGACVQAEFRRLGYSDSRQKPANGVTLGPSPNGDYVRARIQPDSTGRPMLRLEAFRYSNYSGASSVGDRSVDLGGEIIPPSNQATRDLAAVAERCSAAAPINPSIDHEPSVSHIPAQRARLKNSSH